MVRASTTCPSSGCTLLTWLYQVLFKRKPVRFLPAVEIEDENAEVCVRAKDYVLRNHWTVIDLAYSSNRGGFQFIWELSWPVSLVRHSILSAFTYTISSMDFYKQVSHDAICMLVSLTYLSCSVVSTIKSQVIPVWLFLRRWRVRFVLPTLIPTIWTYMIV